MDQSELRQWENRCIQDEPAPCVAACPLHVDARTLIGHVADGNWTKALTVLNKTMPLAGILGRVCDAPCQAVCNRSKVGDAIRIADLERACVAHADRPQRVMPLPQKPIRVAVVGSGLSSLTVVWDLGRKGYAVTVFEAGETVGADLIREYSRRLSEEVVEAEKERLARLGVRFETGVNPDPEALMQSHAAVYVGLDTASADGWNIGREKSASFRFAGDTGRDGRFAGGDHASPVWRAASGRWCATSMDRWLQKVSMDAGREKEGPFETRLITRLEGVVPLPAVTMADPQRGFGDAEARAEADRCLQCECLECVKVCAYLEKFGGYPRTYVREIYNNESIVMGERKSNRLVNSCSLCGLCETVCPNDFAMQDICLAARQSMVEREKMPPSAHDFALRDMAFSQSPDFAMARHAPGTDNSCYLFFPGCQLCASAPGQVRRVYDHLRSELSGGVALMLGCCGAPAHWAGQQALFKEALEQWQTTWVSLGRPQPIVACSSCLQMFARHLPEVDAISLWEVFETAGIPGVMRPRIDAPLAIQDPCTTRDDPGVQDAVRQLLSWINVPIEPLDLERERTECCGFGGLMQNANPELAREVAEQRGRRSSRDYLAYCAMCRDNLAATGKRTWHLLDLIFPDPDLSDPAARPRPGWSCRRENRQRLKEELCRQVWGDAPNGSQAEPSLHIHLEPSVEALLDSRRILESDVQRVIRHAENDGERFFNPETGHRLGMLRTGHATFWVIYSVTADGFAVHNAYAHRMEVVGP
ncbi:pyridine nucleotide-disulfide oxidoreductase/dicluster-binding protein [Desulfosarcina ovata]|uniref:4Fe-4S ferredoxin-type domain-containing protein n=1 Tax=Desulfosarcina ovata subsp. ovata TaxID=2752305 RepID=A0A5K8AGL2_9BACT|nr:pyridine nucleotide-disulfide oxidoreductase/dicluster-binding protein [Desulfosarcina ovata]BBO91787.1 hypothetical protein DSCOOX_49670 [Desulfosarcina ovata subsp. ovata]